MDINWSKRLKPMDITKYDSHHNKQLKQRLTVASTVQSYSLCIEYMKEWFIHLFDTNIFKSIYVDGKNIFDDYRRLTTTQLLRREKPSLAVIPSFSWDFNNDNVDIYQYGLNLYRPLGMYKDAFYKDEKHSSYLGINMETIFMEFTFRIRVDTKSEELDLYKYLQLATRLGNTMGEYTDLDFHIPYSLIIQMAEDAGFEVIPPIDGNENSYPYIKNVQDFITHLNTNSSIPFLYKLRTINGRNEFFIRMSHAYIHIRPTGLSADDGEREQMLNSNFVVEFTAEVRFPAPKFYAYFSDSPDRYGTIFSKWSSININSIITTAYGFRAYKLPDKDENGWTRYLDTTYEDDNDMIGKPLYIELSEVLGDNIKKAIDHCKEMAISPSIFIRFIAINGGRILNTIIDWNDLIIRSGLPILDNTTYLGIYIDKMFINEYMISNTDATENRIERTRDRQ